MMMSSVTRTPREYKHPKLSRLCFILLGVLVWVIISGCESGLSTETQVPAKTSSKVQIIGYIEDLYEQPGAMYISFDQIEWFDGPEAGRAMQEDGLCSDSEPDCEPPNPFYIRNRDEKLVPFRVSEQVAIIMQTLSHQADGNFEWDKRIDLDRFQQAYNSESTSCLKSVPYWITVDRGVVITIREQYIP